MKSTDAWQFNAIDERKYNIHYETDEVIGSSQQTLKIITLLRRLQFISQSPHDRSILKPVRYIFPWITHVISISFSPLMWC